jgi:hypothetical protein
MLQESLFLAAGIGAALGTTVTYAYRLNRKKVDVASKDITGFSANEFINYTLVGALSGLFVIFSTLAVMIKDNAFPSSNPGGFVLELAAMSVVPAALFYISAYLRGAPLASQTSKFALLTLKFAIVHLLLQYSGYYTYVFGR